MARIVQRVRTPLVVGGFFVAAVVAAAPFAAAGDDAVNVTAVDAQTVHVDYICTAASGITTVTVGVYPQENLPEATGSASGLDCDGTAHEAVVAVGGAPLPGGQWVRVRVKLRGENGIAGVKQTRKMFMPCESVDQRQPDRSVTTFGCGAAAG